MKQARCLCCRIHFVWGKDYPRTIKRGNLPRGHIRCPECGNVIAQTTHLCKDRKSRKAPIYASSKPKIRR